MFQQLRDGPVERLETELGKLDEDPEAALARKDVGLDMEHFIKSLEQPSSRSNGPCAHCGKIARSENGTDLLTGFILCLFSRVYERFRKSGDQAVDLFLNAPLTGFVVDAQRSEVQAQRSLAEIFQKVFLAPVEIDGIAVEDMLRLPVGIVDVLDDLPVIGIDVAGEDFTGVPQRLLDDSEAETEYVHAHGQIFLSDANRTGSATTYFLYHECVPPLCVVFGMNSGEP